MRRTVGALLAAVMAVHCRRAPAARTAGSARAPKGDAIWLADAASAGQPGLEDSLQRMGATALFLPAGEVEFESGRWTLHAAPSPPRRLERIPIVLVLRAGPALSVAFQTEQGSDPEAMGRALASALARAVGAGGPYGRVAGVHLDFPFAAAGAPRYGRFVSALRAGLPAALFVSVALPTTPSSPSDREKLRPLLDAADVVLAFVFRDGQRADPAALDSLHRPWWAAFDTASHGVHVNADGGPTEDVPERLLDPLSGSAHIDLENDLSESDSAVSAFHLRARDALRIEGIALARGDLVQFRLPSETELLYQLGSVLSGKRFALGRVIRFEGASDAERVFPVAGFEDVLLGRSLSPALEVAVQTQGKRTVTVEAVNRSAHASIVSRISGWVEVDLAPARPADIQLGGFERYEVYDAAGRPVSPGRATRVRLFETMVAPWETIAAARIAVRGTLPPACCRHRTHLIAAAGPEIAEDWSSPPPAPTPLPSPRKKKRGR